MLHRTIGDLLGEAKASGNLGNTLKVLGRFDEAVVCCQRHLDIARDINDKVRPISDSIWGDSEQNEPSVLTCFSWICVRWVRRELCITLVTCTMPKAKVSVGVELSLEISQRRSWWHWGRLLSTMSEWLLYRMGDILIIQCLSAIIQSYCIWQGCDFSGLIRISEFRLIRPSNFQRAKLPQVILHKHGKKRNI